MGDPVPVVPTSALGLTFSFGFTVSSPGLSATSALTLNTAYSSTNALFPYLTLYAPEFVSTASIATLTLTGVTISWIAGTQRIYAFGFIVGTSAFSIIATVCSINGKATVTVSALTLPYTSDYTPASVKALGADSLTTFLTGMDSSRSD